MNDSKLGEQKYIARIEKNKKLRPLMSYKKRMIISGLFIEEYIYENPINLGQKRFARKRSDKKKEQTKMAKGALRRARMNIMRLVNSNLDFITFATLTFDEKKFKNKKDITEFDKCNSMFTKFIQRLKTRFPEIKYLTVPEFQGDYYYETGIKKEFGGAIHYHLLLNQKIDSQKLEKIWQHGFIKINKIKSINNVGAYVSKYLSKESFNKKYFSKKKFFYSKNLERPQVFKGGECKVVEMTYLPMHEIVYQRTFENEYRGKIQLTSYKLKTGVE